MADITFRSDIVAVNKDHMGGDESVIEAMLVSSDQDQLIEEMMEIPKTEGRIRFLMKNRHGTPFEHNALKFYVEAPIFVFREWHRHRIGWSYNEQSGRYSELPPMFYVPPPERPLMQVGKPGAYTYVEADDATYATMRDITQQTYRISYESYRDMLDNCGIAREVARMVLPVGIYSKMYATCNARSMMAFLSLRTRRDAFWNDVSEALEFPDAGAVFMQNNGGAMFPSGPMWEIEQAANMTEQAFASLFPITHAAFNEHGRVAP